MTENKFSCEVKEAAWNDRAQRLIEKLNPLIGAYHTAELVRSGQCFLHEVIYQNISIGFYIGRVDTLPNSERDLVIMHAISDIKGQKPLLHILGSIFPAVAEQMNCNRIRIHSDQRRIDTLLENAGYEYMETVFKKEL